MTRYDEYDEVKRRNPGPMAAVEAEYDRAFERDSVHAYESGNADFVPDPQFRGPNSVDWCKHCGQSPGHANHTRTLRPLRDFVVIRPLKDEQQGLIEVVRPRDKWRRGQVLEVGPGKRGKDGVHRAWGARAGDIVHFADVLTYPEFDTGTERVLLIQEADICGVEETA